MAEVGKLSPSKITNYEGCKMAYFLRYIEHVKVPTNIRLVFGKSIHYILEQFYIKNYKSDESFSKYWKYNWFSTIAGEFLDEKRKKSLIIKEYLVKKDPVNGDFILKMGNHVDFGICENVPGVFFGYMKLGENILKRFYNKHKHLPPPLHTELSFGVKKDDDLNINGHLIRGVFDRIDKIDERMYITDYKTDKSSPENDSFILHRHPQFTIYSYIFRKIFKRKEKALLYYHLRSGKAYKTHRSEKDYDYIKKLLDDVSEGIFNDRFTPFYGFHCNFCDLKVPCEDYAIDYHGGPKIYEEKDRLKKIKNAETFEKWETEINKNSLEFMTSHPSH